MTLNQLKCFIEVAQYRNFSEAAKRLHMVQSGVSYHITELEKELNVKLFLRDQKCVELTYAGEQLLEKAFQIASLERDIQVIAHKVSSGVTGKLRIGYPYVPIVYRYRDQFKRFQDKNPLVDMVFGAFPDPEIIKRIENNQLDIAISREVVVGKSHQICWKPLYQDPMCIVVSQDHPLAHRKTASIKDMEQEVLLITGRRYSPGWFDLVMDACFRENCSPEINDRTNDVYSVFLMVEMGLGFTVLPKSWEPTINHNLHFLEFENGYATELGIAWHKGGSNDCVRLFLQEFGIQDGSFYIKSS